MLNLHTWASFLCVPLFPAPARVGCVLLRALRREADIWNSRRPTGTACGMTMITDHDGKQEYRGASRRHPGRTLGRRDRYVLIPHDYGMRTSRRRPSMWHTPGAAAAYRPHRLCMSRNVNQITSARSGCVAFRGGARVSAEKGPRTRKATVVKLFYKCTPNSVGPPRSHVRSRRAREAAHSGFSHACICILQRLLDT